MAQEATIAAPVAPGEDVAVQAVPVAEPVAVIEAAPVQAEGSVMSTQMYDAAAYGAANSGCVGCGGVVATGTMTSAPAMGCCGQAAPVVDSGCCGQAAPVADCGCDPCQRGRRQVVRTVSTRSRSFRTRTRMLGSRRNNCCN
jgi:hypothetical protein